MPKEARKEPYLDMRPRSEGEPGDKVLIVFRPVPFGYGLMVFFVDRVDEVRNKEDAVMTRTAYANDKFVMSFPGHFDYMLVDREKFEFRDPADDEPEKSELTSPDMTHPGQYA